MFKRHLNESINLKANHCYSFVNAHNVWASRNRYKPETNKYGGWCQNTQDMNDLVNFYYLPLAVQV